MKIIMFIIEAITSPFSLILRTTSNRRNVLSNYAKPLIVFIVALIIVVSLVLYFYRDYIFN